MSEIEAVQVRFESSVGIADSDWLTLSPGVSVLTGRNNVGKSRILRTIGELSQAASNPAPVPNVPLVRIVTGDSVIESDTRYFVQQNTGLAPKSFTIHDKQGQLRFDTKWIAFQPNQPALSFGEPGRGQTWHGSGGSLAQVNSIIKEATPILDAVFRIIYIPPERPVRAGQGTIPVVEPKPDGSDLPQVIYYHIGHATPQAQEIQRVIVEMFPEVEQILTPPTGANLITLMIRDRFAKQTISLNDAGTGLARILHIVSCVVIYKKGRILLIDEPTTHLHPGSEKVLAAFFRKHSEHDYVISTHSPIFINAIQPDRAWLMVRDQRGSVIQPAFTEQASRRHVFQELGVSVGDIAIAERLLFVEGLTDRLVYPIILGKLNWDLVAFNCEVIDLVGSEVAPPLQKAVDQLTAVINVRYLIYLDGDQAGSLKGERVKYLPLPEIEDLFLRDPSAIRTGFLKIIEQEHPDLLEKWISQWPPERIAEYILSRQKKDKGKKVLIDLAHEMALEYRPAVYGPAIARAMDVAHLEFLRKDFTELFS